MPTSLSTKLSRQIATISQWPEWEARNYLENNDTKNTPEIQRQKALGLVLTLKHIANPLGGYPGDDNAKTALENVIACLEDPTLLQSQSKLMLTPEEKKYLIDALRIKLDKLADEISIENKIQPEEIQAAITKKTPATTTSEEDLPQAVNRSVEDDWWASHNNKQRKQISQRYANLNDTQKTYLNERVTYTTRYYHYSNKDKFNYYQMCLIDAELEYLALRTIIDLNAFTMRGALRGVSAFPYYSPVIIPSFNHHSSHQGFSCGNCSGGDKEAVLAILAIFAFIALATAAIVGTLYGAKKAFNSIRNIFNGEKILRSLYRLLGIAGGAYLGVLGGAVIGAALGSVIPGVGTAVGAILGMIFGACASAGIGALITKYSAKLFSFCITQDALNPTNPNKWRLSKKRLRQMYAKGIDIHKVELEIAKIRDAKNQLWVSSSFFWTDERKEKTRLNQQLKEIKKIDLQYPPNYQFFKPIRLEPAIPSVPPIEYALSANRC